MTAKTCDNCGVSEYSKAVFSNNRNYLRAYVVPDEYEHICRECAKELNTHSADDMSDEELIAAIVGDSIGYATPRHAANHVADYRSGKTGAFCERAGACFDGDLDALIESARRYWLNRSEEHRKRALKGVEKWAKIQEEDAIASLGLSMSFPTTGF